MESNSVCNSTSDEQNGMTKKQESDLLIMGMIRDKKGQQEVLLSINQIHDKFWEETRHSWYTFSLKKENNG